MVDNSPIYQERIDKFNAELDKAKKQHNITSIARLAVFFITAFLVWYVYKINPVAILGVLAGGAVAFILLVRRAADLKEKLQYYEALVLINENEMSAGYGGYLSFEMGNNYLDAEHPYSSDMDIFGQGSLFQYMNRTVTMLGRNMLANWLSVPQQQIEIIKKRQEAVKELSPLLDWRQDFQAAGSNSEEEAKDKQTVVDWLQEPIYFSNKWYFKVALIAMPVIMFALIIAAVLGYVDAKIAGTMFFAQLGFSLLFARRINDYHSKVSERHEVLKKYATLVKLIEQQNFQSELLTELAAKLRNDDKPASQSFMQLTKIVDSFESRQNILGAVITNGLFLWDLQNAVRLEKWKESFKESLTDWFDVPAEFDSLISLATMYYNRPAFTFPEVLEGSFMLEAKDMGHPMLYEATRIDNDLTIDGPGNFILTTGANMAGKSTFLRAVGVNLVLAMAGAPVCAGSFRFAPTEIYTSMRASDSLLEHASFFYAELSKLKNIVDALHEGRSMFILLDEILKGTNSKDQQTGSRGFIEQLVSLGASGMVATHDLGLGVMAQEYPGKIRNMCFEIAIEDDEMVFDYKIKDGITQSLNATFLMKKMGITV